MTRSDFMPPIAQRARDGQCVLGCTQRGVHYATCPDYSNDLADATCRGCAPTPAHEGSAICARCFGRMKAILRDAPDLLGRVRSLSDPTKAMQIATVKVSSRPVEAVAPVGPDLLDAADTILANLRDWAHSIAGGGLPWHSRYSGMTAVSAYRLADAYCRAISKRLDQLTADPARSVRLAEALTVIHPEVEGERAAWSVADALARWGAERRDRHVHPDVDVAPDRAEVATPVREWYDPVLTIKDAAERVSKHLDEPVAPRALRKWIESGHLPVAMRVRGPRGSVMIAVHASRVDQVAVLMETQKTPPRPGVGEAASISDTPVRN